MNTMHEQLWSYIDGTCTPEERVHIADMLLDAANRQQYEELLQLHNGLKTLALDEPAMAFTYNVMEQIRTQEAKVPLKAAINQTVIWGIAAFFILTISALLFLTMRHVNWASAPNHYQIPATLNTNSIKGFFTGTFMKGFLFVDMVLVLFLLDGYLRRKTTNV
jgi:hypothetical protein